MKRYIVTHTNGTFAILIGAAAIKKHVLRNTVIIDEIFELGSRVIAQHVEDVSLTPQVSND